MIRWITLGQGCCAGPMVECPAGNACGVFMRFTIRDVMLLTAVLALALAWWLDHWRLGKANYDLKEAYWDLKETYMRAAIARSDASYQALSYKQALAKAEAKLKASSQRGQDSN